MLLSPVNASSRKGQAEWKMQGHRCCAFKTCRYNETTVSSFYSLLLHAQLYWSRFAVKVSLIGLGKLPLMNLLQSHSLEKEELPFFMNSSPYFFVSSLMSG